VKIPKNPTAGVPPAASAIPANTEGFESHHESRVEYRTAETDPPVPVRAKARLYSEAGNLGLPPKDELTQR